MVILKLQGGLGNQLFQYAAYSRLREKFSEAYLDITEYNLPYNDGYRKFLLNEFNTIELRLMEFYCSRSKKIKSFFKKKRILMLSSKMKKQFKFISWIDSRSFDSNLLEIEDNSYIEGYFLHERFLSKPVKDFTFFSQKILNDEFVKMHYNSIINENSVSIHIRRTDYLTNSDYNDICTINYYTEAMSYITHKISQPIFYFFSDDINWVKKTFGTQNNYRFIDNKNDNATVVDLFLMSSCRANIIANSTYSWWGAYLNKNKNKIVIRPPRYTNKTNDESLFPPDWTKLN